MCSHSHSICFGSPMWRYHPPIPPVGFLPIQALPTMPPTLKHYIKEKYHQVVQRRAFLHSSQLLQYAKERQTTPNHLWLTFVVHCKKYRLDNTVGNLIEFLGITPKTFSKEEKDTETYKTYNNAVYKAPTENGLYGYNAVYNTAKENEHHGTANNVVYNTPKESELYMIGHNNVYQTLAENEHYVTMSDNNAVYDTTKKNERYVTASRTVYYKVEENEPYMAGNYPVYTAPTESEQYMTGIHTVHNTPTENVQYMATNNQACNAASNTYAIYKGFINCRGTVYNKAVTNAEYYNYGTIYEGDQDYESYEQPVSCYESNATVFPDSYTYEDFLIVKKAAEDEFERECLEEDAKTAGKNHFIVNTKYNNNSGLAGSCMCINHN